MSRLIAKILLLIIPSVIIANVLSLAILSSETLSSFFVTKKFANETYIALKKSKIVSLAEIIILGDSSSRYVFEAEKVNKAKYYNLASNYCASMLGQYIIASNALSSNTHIKKIYLFYHPEGFNNNLDQPWTFNYVVKPFYTSEYRSFFSENAINKLKRKKLFFLFVLPMFKTMPIFTKIDYGEGKWSGIPKVVQQKPIFSEIAIEYLKKLEFLCKDKKVTLLVLMPPITKKYDADFSLMKSQIDANNFNSIFKLYFDSKIILDDMYFKDGLHPKKNYFNKLYALVDAYLERL